MQDGQEVILKNEGEQNPEWSTGDLIFVL